MFGFSESALEVEVRIKQLANDKQRWSIRGDAIFDTIVSQRYG